MNNAQNKQHDLSKHTSVPCNLAERRIFQRADE